MSTTVGWSEHGPSHARAVKGGEMRVKETLVWAPTHPTAAKPCPELFPEEECGTNTTTPRDEGWHIPNQHTQGLWEDAKGFVK